MLHVRDKAKGKMPYMTPPSKGGKKKVFLNFTQTKPQQQQQRRRK